MWMRHEAPLPPGPEIVVEEVPYDAVDNLRVAWGLEEIGRASCRERVCLVV